MSKFKLNRELLEYRRQRTEVWSSTITKIFKYLMTATATIIPFRFVFLSIDSLAGLDTDADINVVFDVIKNTSVRGIIFLCIGIAGIVYGLTERRIRVTKVKRLSMRVKSLEKELDNDRQSSRLNRTGSTRREDE